MYSFVNKDLPIGGGLEMPTLGIQVREAGGRGSEIWKKGSTILLVY